ncbi:MAG: HAMP domain-containing histidine kinase, partial [Elusimicrobia bacterium]|nr:HAMP domain-containing histidine kinase [Elusimicrobiota bacterium]
LREEAASQKILPEGAAYIRLIEPDGAVMAFADPNPQARYDLGRLAPPQGQAPAWGTAPSPDDEDALDVASQRLEGGALLQVGMGTAAREAFLERFRGIVAAVLLPLALLSIVGGILLTRRALSPLRDLIATIRAIEGGSLDSRVAIRGTGDELDELGLLFNGMLDKVAALVAGMRGALDDAAHDLRTPLTRLRGGAELALRSGDAAALKESLADCVEESDAILAMLDGLMDVAEAESGTMRLRLENVDARGLLEEAVELYGPSAEEKGLRLQAEAPAGLVLRADRARLRRAVANLVDNAVKFTPRGGTIIAMASLADDRIVLSVRDDGPGIPETDLPRIWDRLFRGDRSRSERGLGLGLSLVKAIVEAHGGRASVESRTGEGSAFLLSFPAA